MFEYKKTTSVVIFVLLCIPLFISACTNEESTNVPRPLPQEQNSSQMPMAKLNIYRGDRWHGGFMDFELALNGTIVASVSNNSYYSCEIPAGLYQVHIYMSRFLFKHRLTSLSYEEKGLFWELEPGRNYYFDFSPEFKVWYEDANGEYHFYLDDGLAEPLVVKLIDESYWKTAVTDEMEQEKCVIEESATSEFITTTTVTSTSSITRSPVTSEKSATFGLIRTENLASGQAPTAFNPKDDAVYVYIPAGDFLLGSPTGEGDSDEHPQSTVYLDAFWIMQTEVTNAQYRRCIEAGRCTLPHNNQWQDDNKLQHPVSDIDWNQANAYALWSGGRLPTEVEWEKACRGENGRRFPWGDTDPNLNLAHYAESLSAILVSPLIGEAKPVGQYPRGASPYGILDMAGNISEWTNDFYSESFYSSISAQNPSGPPTGQYRVARGASYNYPGGSLRCADRWRERPEDWEELGLRVAFSAP